MLKLDLHPRAREITQDQAATRPLAIDQYGDLKYVTHLRR